MATIASYDSGLHECTDAESGRLKRAKRVHSIYGFIPTMRDHNTRSELLREGGGSSCNHSTVLHTVIHYYIKAVGFTTEILLKSFLISMIMKIEKGKELE